jgi:hypothetical protein
MKKIILFLSILFTGSFLQSSAQVSFSPTVFTAEDEVTITVDVTGTPMAGKTEAYIWIFSNPTAGSGTSKDGIVNGAWTNSNVTGKMTPAGTNKWSFKFVGTTMFNQTPAELKEFGFLVKAKNGSDGQTPDYKPYKFDPLIFVPSVFRVFPSKVGQDDVITLNFDQTLAATITEERMTATTVSLVFLDQTGTQIGTTQTVNAKSGGNKLWMASFIPTRLVTVPAGKKIEKIKYKFNGTLLDINGASSNVSSSENELTLVDMK